jgi:hypothetical protein
MLMKVMMMMMLHQDASHLAKNATPQESVNKWEEEKTCMVW